MTGVHRALIVVAVLVGVMFGLPGVGAVREAAAQISVASADPKSGEQGTLNLNVLIKGRGFKNGAKAKFFKTGTTDPAGVNVKSTQFVNSTQLIASIDIADAAALSLFDIEVANTDGRTGKGTELFSVTEKNTGRLNPIPVYVTLSDASDDVGTPSAIRAEGDSAESYPAYLNPYTRDDGTLAWFVSWQVILSSRTSPESQRSVVFEFEPRLYNSNGTVSCYPTSTTLDPEDAAKGPYYVKTPEFLSTYPAIPDGTQKPINILVNTKYEWVQDENGMWSPTSEYFDVGQYFNSPATAPESAVVAFMIIFRTPELDDKNVQVVIAPNGPRAFVKSVGNAWGLAQILKANGGFEIRPLPLDVLNSGLHDIYAIPSGYPLDPLPAFQPSTQPGQANLSLIARLAPKLGYKAGNAVCDLGAFWMPFRMLVTR